MPTIAEVRAQYPQYDDLSDDQLASAIRQKFYADMPEQEFRAKVGMDAPAPEAEPPTKEPSQRGSFLDSFLGQGVMMGFGDEAKAGVTAARKKLLGDDRALGDIYSEEHTGELADVHGFRERHPYLAPATEIAGSVAGIAATGGAGLAARGATVAGKAALGAAEGAGYGAVQGFASGEGGFDKRLENAAYGTAGGAAGGALGGAIAGRAAQKVASRAVPSTAAIEDTGRAAFKEMAAEGIALRPASAQNLLASVLRPAAQRRVDPIRHPHTYAVLQHTARLSQRSGGMTLEEAHQVRQWLGTARRTKSPDLAADRELAGELTEALDDTIEKLTPLDTTGGKNPAKATAALRKGIDNWRVARKSEIIDDILANAEIDAAQNYTQAGMAHAVRNGFKALAKNKAKMRAFTPDEQRAIRNVAIGGKMQVNLTNIMRGLGKFAPRGPITGALIGGAAMNDLPTAAAILGVAETGKKIATSRTMGAARSASELVRGGSGKAVLSAADKQKIRAAIAAGENVPEEVRALLGE